MIAFLLAALLAAVVASMSYVGTRSYVVGAKAATGTSMTTLTAVDANLSADATAILAYWAVAGMAAETTVESNGGQVQFLLGGQQQVGPFSGQPWTGNGAATNEEGVTRLPDVWPVAVPKGVEAGDIGGLAISAKGMNSALGTPTNSQSMVAGVITWEGPLPDQGTLDMIRNALGAGQILPMRNGANSAAATGVTANATALPNITVPPDANVLTGFSTVWSTDGALTAGVEVVGWVDFTSNISGFGTQRVPIAAMDASLGTAVGSPVSVPQLFWPSFIPTAFEGGKKSGLYLTPTVRLNATVDGVSIEANAFWR